MADVIDSYQWLQQYERLKTDFQGKRKFAPNLTNVDSKDMLERISALEKQLNIMRESPMEYEITISEIGRRQFILESLRKQISTASTGGDSRLQLLASNNAQASASNNGNGGNGNNQPSTTFNPLATSDKALIQRQQEVIKMQDEIILDIEKGVDRLNVQAKDIGKEAKIHTKILEDLDVHVDEATEKLKEETKHAELIKQRTNDCYAYMCIVVEAIVLFVLLLVVFVHI